MQNKVVVHFLNSEIIKGVTNDFFSHKQFFHVTDLETTEIVKIDLYDLKAVFFVKTFAGNPDYKEKVDVERTGSGKRIKVLFKDGETFIGYTQGFSPDRRGFFVIPADPDSNNIRIFVNKSAANEITFIREGMANKVDKEKSDKMEEEDVMIRCTSCGVQNRLKTSKLILNPRCGKCGTVLI